MPANAHDTMWEALAEIDSEIGKRMSEVEEHELTTAQIVDLLVYLQNAARAALKLAGNAPPPPALPSDNSLVDFLAKTIADSIGHGMREKCEPQARAIAPLVSVLVEALRPFAYVPGEGDEDFPDDTKVTLTFGRTTDFTLTLGDLRRALTALNMVDA